MKRLFLIISLSIFIFSSALAIPKLEKVLTPKQMKKDIDCFFEFVEHIHPDMYAYTSKEEMEQSREELYKKCSVPLTFRKFLRHFLRLNDLFDGHTGIQLWNVLYQEVKEPVFFPQPVQLRDGSLFLMQQNNYPGNPREIISINNVGGNEIYNTLFRTCSFENTRHRELYIENSFSQRLFYLAGLEAPFKVVIKQSKIEKIDTLTLQGVNSRNIKNAYIGAFGCPFRNFRVFPPKNQSP